MARSSTQRTASRYSRCTTHSASNRDTAARPGFSSPEVEVTFGTERPGMLLAAGLTDPELYKSDPYPLYARLRDEAAMAWNEEVGFWAVSTHADVVAAESDAPTFCAGRGILVEGIGIDYAGPPTILHTDPPEHTRYRRLVQPGFKPSVTRDLEPVVRKRARALIEELEAGVPVDVVQALSV